MKQSRVNRVIGLLSALQSAKRYEIAELAGMTGRSVRTLYRDLEELRTAGFPCRREGRGSGRSRITNVSLSLPVPALTAEEALGLLLLAFKAGNHLNLPFHDAILRAAIKVEAMLSPDIRRHCNCILHNISIRHAPQTTTALLDRTFSALQTAILKKQAVKCTHRTEGCRKLAVELCPLHLVYASGNWQLIGATRRTDEIRNIKLHQIERIDLLPVYFGNDRRFDCREHFGRAWAVAPEGTLYNIKLRFAADIAADVAAVQWHETQTVVFENSGSAVLEFRVDGLDEITSWILSYGGKATVLAPRLLRQRVADAARRMAGRTATERSTPSKVFRAAAVAMP